MGTWASASPGIPLLQPMNLVSFCRDVPSLFLDTLALPVSASLLSHSSFSWLQAHLSLALFALLFFSVLLFLLFLLLVLLSSIVVFLDTSEFLSSLELLSLICFEFSLQVVPPGLPTFLQSLVLVLDMSMFPSYTFLQAHLVGNFLGTVFLPSLLFLLSVATPYQPRLTGDRRILAPLVHMLALLLDYSSKRDQLGTQRCAQHYY